MREIRAGGQTFRMSDRTYELVCEGARLEEGRALEAFDEHQGGQLRIGAAGDQTELFALEDERIPSSDGPALTSPALEELARDLEPWRCDRCGRDRRESWHDVHCDDR